MASPSSRIPAFLPALGLLGVLAACNVAQPAQDDPTRYFVLSDPPLGAPAAAPGSALRIGLHSVTLDPYLRRREMVVRTGVNEVQFRTYRLWAEPLEAAATRVIRGRLLASPRVIEVSRDPFPSGVARDFDVSVEIRHCEGLADPSGGASASLSAVVEVWTAGPAPALVARREFKAPAAPWNSSDFGQLAGLLSADLASLADEILAEIPVK
jgi:uncharacterized lipoprotein YmbA